MRYITYNVTLAVLFIGMFLAFIPSAHAAWCALVNDNGTEREICGTDEASCWNNIQNGPNPCHGGNGCTVVRDCTDQGGTTLQNPLRGTNTIWDFFDKVMDVVVRIAAPIIVFFLIFAGFKFVTAGGNREKISGAKKTLGYVVVGAIIILSARIITAILAATVSGITGV